MILILLALSSLYVLGAYTITLNSPARYSIQNQTTVDFNWTVVDSGGSTDLNCSVWTKTSRTGAYGRNITIGVTNGTPNNISLPFADNSRVWWQVSCYDLQSEFTTTKEIVTVPADTALVTFNNGDDGVIVTGASVNYSDTRINESIASIPAAGTHVDLVGNNTVVSVSEVLVNVTGAGGLFNVSLVENTDFNITNGVVYMMSSDYATNTSLWSYTWINETPLIANYNNSGGVVYMNTSTFQGDISWWNYTYPYDAYVNEANSTSRVLDVDDYYNEFLSIYVPLQFVGQSTATCDTTSAGSIYYDSDDNKHYGCNSTDWNSLY